VNRHVKDHIGKKNIILMDWKVIIFDHEGFKTMKVIWSLSIHFLHDKCKIILMEINEVKGDNLQSNTIYNISKSTLQFF